MSSKQVNSPSFINTLNISSWPFNVLTSTAKKVGGLKPPPAPPPARSLKTQLFLYGYGFRPHVSDENDQWKRNFLKTLFSRVRVDRRKQGKTSTWITQISNKNKNLSKKKKLSESLCSLFFTSSISLRKAWLEHTKHVCRAQSAHAWLSTTTTTTTILLFSLLIHHQPIVSIVLETQKRRR